MKTVEIQVKKREKLGKSETRRLRNQEMVPCVMYGGEENLHFYAHENFFNKVVFSPDVFQVILDIEGTKKKAIIQEIQFHPVTDKIIHLDFVEIIDGKPVIATIPVTLSGISVGVRNGGKLRQRRRYLKVKGLAENLPDKLDIDISGLDIAQVIKVGDLDYPDLEILDPHRSMIVSVVSSRVAMKSMTVTEEGAEAEEGAEEAPAAAEEGTTGENAEE
ncbi:MAG TPA: 50S ribosomal protein L25/general stress protein Ctc [Bacteroidales bacterium]|nr:50S ribosomal protein L25/general stress protein Ctc [Bacteroidales bacterium]